MINFPSKLHRFSPPKAKFPGNKIPKFHILAMYGMPTHRKYSTTMSVTEFCFYFLFHSCVAGPVMLDEFVEWFRMRQEQQCGGSTSSSSSSTDFC